MSVVITDEMRRRYAHDGVVCLPGALDARAMDLARAAFDWSMDNPSTSASTFETRAQNAGRFYQDLANGEALPAYRSLIEQTNVADIVADLWGASDVWFMYEQVFLKEGGNSRRTPWHQDTSYLPIEGDEIAVMWISFDPVKQADSLEFVRGSHRGVLYNGSAFDPDDDTVPLYPTGTMPRLPDIEADRAKFDIVSWAVEPGDVVVFHPSVMHGGAPTHPGGRRRTLSLRFFGNKTIYVSRPNEGMLNAPDVPENMFSQVARTLKHGDPFRHARFPKLRPAA
ncbi:phytanoyl-CoA dioxygenase family protein [Zavarzinia sp. CC-PAN008]|uniref:phytanoyl-CoA dioxygenase family protein n=1 Tax=Zavarzinia sp. CC-PAN008 TaxID=3243332 RepID=UPI003F747689